MNTAQEIALLIISLAKRKKLTVKQLLLDCELGKNTVDYMKNGSMPSADKLAVIAKYLDVSMEYLIGLTDNPKPPTIINFTQEQLLMMLADQDGLSEDSIRQLKEYANLLKIKDMQEHNKKTDEVSKDGQSIG